MVNIASISSRTPGTGHWWQSGCCSTEFRFARLLTLIVDRQLQKKWLAPEYPKPPKIAVSSRVAQFDSGDVVGGAAAFDGSY